MTNEKKPIVVFSMDDGLMTDYTKVYPIFNKRGIRGTSYVTTSLHENTTNGSFMRKPYLKMLKENGWDIQCHFHEHVQLTTLTQQEIVDSLEKVNEELNSFGIGIPEHHAYPYGSYNAEVQNALKPYRKTGRLIGHTSTSYAQIQNNPYQIVACNMDIQNETDFERIIGVIDNVINTDEIVVLFFHNVQVNESTSVTEDYLTRIVDYVINTKTSIMTFKEMYDYVSNTDVY